MPSFDTIELTVNNTLYIIEGDYEGGWVDNGIGGYEYWGAKGTHHDWCYEVESYDWQAYDAEGNDITDTLPDAIKSSIDSSVSDTLNNRCEQMDPSDRLNDNEPDDDPPERDYD